MEVEQPNSGNSCLIGRKTCKLIKETQKGKMLQQQQKTTEKTEEPGFRREGKGQGTGKLHTTYQWSF